MIKESWENIADSLCAYVSSEFLREQLHIFANNGPHLAGSERNNELAGYIESVWKNWGWPIVRRQEFFVHLPLGPSDDKYLNEVVLTDFEGNKVIHVSQNFVTVIPSNNNPVNIPVFQAYSCNANVTGSFVFINYGLVEDLDEFDKAQGRESGQPSVLCNSSLIAIARLGRSTRQAKLSNLLTHCTCGHNGTPLSNHHPKAIVFFPDPIDFVAQNTLVYPDGPGLPGDAPVFGNINMSGSGGGDPECSNRPSSLRSFREKTLVAGNALTSIPVQPIGYNDAKVILSYLDGAEAPKIWNSVFTNYIGPSTKTKLNVVVRNQISKELIKCTNLLAIMPGDTELDETDQYIVCGNHRDAWIQGACDPGSGTIIHQQIAKILGNAYKKGFRPRRTIILASWDCEEFSLIGSTHFVQCLSTEVFTRTVAYLNVDCPIKGNQVFSARTDPLLADVLYKSSRLVKVDPPRNNGTFYDEWFENQVEETSEPFVSQLGGGSDQVPFAYRFGIPSSYPQYWPNDGLFNLPVYHTNFDNVEIVERFTDPSNSIALDSLFPRHKLITRLLLTMIIQLACSPRLPLAINRLIAELIKNWHNFVQQVNQEIENFSEFELNLDWVTEELIDLQKSGIQFEEIANNFELQLEKFPSHLNRIIGGLSKHFVNNNCTIKKALRNLINGVKGYKSEYFPHVRLRYKELLKLIQTDPNNLESALNNLKLEISNLIICLSQTANWLRNGLIGMDMFKTQLPIVQ